MGTKLNELEMELRAALIERREAKAKYLDAKTAASEARTVWSDKQKLVDEIETEIETGKNPRAIIDQVGTIHTSEFPTEEEMKRREIATSGTSKTREKRKAVPT